MQNTQTTVKLCYAPRLYIPRGGGKKKKSVTHLIYQQRQAKQDLWLVCCRLLRHFETRHVTHEMCGIATHRRTRNDIRRCVCFTDSIGAGKKVTKSDNEALVVILKARSSYINLCEYRGVSPAVPRPMNCLGTIASQAPAQRPPTANTSHVTPPISFRYDGTY